MLKVNIGSHKISILVRDLKFSRKRKFLEEIKIRNVVEVLNTPEAQPNRIVFFNQIQTNPKTTRDKEFTNV